MSHAIAVCASIASAASRREPISRLTAASAATHGIYSSVKQRKVNALSGVNSCESSGVNAVVSPTPISTARVLTTASLAVSPVNSAVDACHEPKPSGTKMGAMSAPMAASMLFALSATIFRRKSKLCKNQMRIVATKMMVKARCIKSLAFSHICRSNALAARQPVGRQLHDKRHRVSLKAKPL